MGTSVCLMHDTETWNPCELFLFYSVEGAVPATGAGHGKRGRLHEAFSTIHRLVGLKK